MHAYYSKLAAGDTVCLTIDVQAEISLEERELGMITAVTFTGTGVIYNVTWSDRTVGQHIEQELTLVTTQVTEESNPEEN